MKILRIIARLNVGGPARHVVWLTKALQTAEFHSTLLAGTVPEGEADMSYFAVENGVQPIYLPELSRELSLKDLISLVKIYRLIRDEKPDIIHTHTAKAGTVGRTAAFLYRWMTWRTLLGRPRSVKIVHTFHGHVFHSYYGRAKTGVFVLIEKMLARLATDRIVVITDQQFDEIHGKFGVGRSSQFTVIPLGIDLEAYAGGGSKRDLLRREIGAADDEVVIGILGRLTEIKNLPMFLDAAAGYIKRGGLPKMRFVIIGDGHLGADLRALALALGLDDSVTFLGNRHDAADLIHGLDIVALTSKNEGTPLSLIEAMAAGKPVIATAVGGVVDLLGEIVDRGDGFDIRQRGITVGTDQTENFLNGLISLAKDEKLRARYAESGRRFVIDKYSVDRLVKDIESLYTDLIRDHGV